MYILKTTTKETIKIDADELDNISKADNDTLIYFRNGAVKKSLIGVILLDTEKAETILRLPNESAETARQRKLSEKSEDIFKDYRQSKKELLP